MKETAKGFRCPRCGKVTASKSHVTHAQKISRKRVSSDIYIVEKPRDHHAKVVQPCPKCGNQEAFHWVSSISGEHAGIRRERTIEHFQCTKCSHAWTKAT